MSKSTSMLPSLAGGSGVASHALVGADLMKVVDAVTLNADRDRKVTLDELKAFLVAPDVTALDGRLDALEPKVSALQTYVVNSPASTTIADLTVETALATVTLTEGVWVVSGQASLLLGVGANVSASAYRLKRSDGGTLSSYVYDTRAVAASASYPIQVTGRVVSVVGSDITISLTYRATSGSGIATATPYILAQRIA